MEKIRNIIKSKFKLSSMAITSVIALFLSCLIYINLFPFFTYSNLKDFYVGPSIYLNHNKYLDIGIFFIYIVLFYIIYFFQKFQLPKIKINVNFQKYKKIINIVIFLVCLILVVLYIINFYVPGIYDPHHYGEKFGAYWLHRTYGMKYYKDIMLVHGYLDVIPSWIADKILGGLTYLNERIGMLLFQLIFLLFNVVAASFVFKRKYFAIFIASGLFMYVVGLQNINDVTLYTSFLHIETLILGYLLLLEKIIQNIILYGIWDFIYFLFSELHTIQQSVQYAQ